MSESLRDALKVIRRHSQTVAKFIVALEKKKTGIVPAMVYENLEEIQWKLQEIGTATSDAKISESGIAIIEFLQSVISLH